MIFITAAIFSVLAVAAAGTYLIYPRRPRDAEAEAWLTELKNMEIFVEDEIETFGIALEDTFAYMP